MMNSLPTPYPGESLYSIYCRYHVRSGMSPVQTSKTIFRREYVNLASTVLSPSSLFTTKSRNFIGLSLALELAQKHTALQYYSASFFSWDLSEAEDILQGKICLESRNFWRRFLNLVKKDDARLCYCMECSKEERKMYGEPYWHTLHQINGVEYCPIHKTPLIKSNAVLSRNTYNNYYPAYLYTKEAQTMAISENVAFKREMIHLSEDINWLLCNGWSLGCSRQISITYIQHILEQNNLEDIQLLKYNLMRSLNGLAYEQYAGSLPESFLNTLELSRQKWHITLKPFFCRFAFNPLQHALYMRGHFGSVKNFSLQYPICDAENIYPHIKYN